MWLKALQFNGNDMILVFSCSDIINDELSILSMYLACFRGVLDGKGAV